MRLLQGVAQIGMAALGITPEGYLFNMGASGAQEVLPDKLSNALMQPVTTAMQFINTDP